MIFQMVLKSSDNTFHNRGGGGRSSLRWRVFFSNLFYSCFKYWKLIEKSRIPPGFMPLAYNTFSWLKFVNISKSHFRWFWLNQINHFQHFLRCMVLKRWPENSKMIVAFFLPSNYFTKIFTNKNNKILNFLIIEILNDDSKSTVLL